MSGLVLIGGGEHARVVGEAARLSGIELRGYVDPVRSLETEARLRVAYLGDDDALRSLGGVSAVLALGDARSAVRRRVMESVAPYVSAWMCVVHPSAYVSPTATVEDGAVVMAGALVQTGAQIGRHAVVNTGAILEHDVRIGTFTQVAPGVAIGGGTEVGDDAYIGIGATVRDHLVLGPKALVAMGAVVIRNVGAGERVQGVPAR